MKIKQCILHISFALISFNAVVASADIEETSNLLIKKIEELAIQELSNSDTPSLQISVARDNQIVFEGAFGKADLENNVDATMNSKYRIASVTKWFTATAAMMLLENGSLDLDIPIQKYCPEFPVKENPITARQLLTHTAGIRGYIDYDEAISESKNKDEVAILEKKKYKEELSFYTRYIDVIKPLDTFKDDSLIFTPGSEWQYTSFGYRVLACVIQGASKTDYRQLMQELIFTPSNMTDTVADDAWLIIPNRVEGYQLERGEPIRKANMRDVSENLPAGGYLSTSSDLVKFAMAYNLQSLVSENAKALMMSPAILETIDDDTEKSWRDAIPSEDKYGYGLMLFSKYEQGMIGHTGRQDGGSAIVVLIPKSGLTIAVLTNAKGWNGYLGFISKIKEIVEKNDV